MLDGAYGHIAATDHRTAGRSLYIFGHSIDHRLILKVDTLYLIAMIFRSGHEFRLNLHTCVKALAYKCETFFKCCLLHDRFILFFYFFSSFETRSFSWPNRLR